MLQQLFATAHVLQPDTSETEAKRGLRWSVRIIDAGLADSGIYYPIETLHEAAPLFEGVPVIVRSDEDHVQGRDTNAGKTVGWIKDVERVPEGLNGTLELLESDPANIPQKLAEAWDRGKRDLLGLSIVAFGRGKLERTSNGTRKVATAITRARSVDIVVHPAAGGGLLDLVAAEGASPGGVQMFDQVMKFLEAEHPELHTALQKRIDAGETVTDSDLLQALQDGATALREAQKNEGDTSGEGEASNGDNGDDGGRLDRLAEAVSSLQTLMTKRDDSDHKAEALAAAKSAAKLTRFVEARLSNVAPAVAEMVREDLPEDYTEAEFEALLTKSAKRAARISGFSGMGEFMDKDGNRVTQMGMSEGERVRLAADGFFAEADQKHPKTGEKVTRFHSALQMYGEMTGDTSVSGMFTEADRLASNVRGMNNPDLWEQYPGERMFAEAITTSTWASVFADTLRRATVREYQEDPNQQWRLLADVVSTPDYRLRHAIRMGGYGKLGLIAQDGLYDSFTSPTDDESTYSPSKYGGTDYVTREAFLNDDVGQIRRLPSKFGKAAAYTLNWFVTSALFADNPNMTGTDVTALFVAGHANFGTGALTASTLASARLRMRKQTMAAVDADANWDSATTRRIQVWPKYLWGPVDLEQTMFELTVAQNAAVAVDATAPSYTRSWGLTPVVVPHWADTNNWFLSADKSMGPIIEIGFVQGKQNPDIFVQDQPTVGAMFTNDRMTFKMRHEYGGTAVDSRLVDGSIVA